MTKHKHAVKRDRPADPSDESVLSRYDLYELTVQKPDLLVGLLRAIHGHSPRILGEDFSGGAALSRCWARAVPKGKAIAADIDLEPLARARGAKDVKLIHGDVRTSTALSRQEADVIFVGNFSIGEIHERDELVLYLRRRRKRLKNAGVFVCDIYGGVTAFACGTMVRVHPGPPSVPGLQIRYTWEQRAADPLTGRVENALHYRVELAGEVIQEITDAFVYRWRLWSVPELREAMREAGFPRTEVFSQLPDAVDAGGEYHIKPIDDPEDVDESYIVCVAARLS